MRFGVVERVAASFGLFVCDFLSCSRRSRKSQRRSIGWGGVWLRRSGIVSHNDRLQPLEPMFIAVIIASEKIDWLKNRSSGCVKRKQNQIQSQANQELTKGAAHVSIDCASVIAKWPISVRRKLRKRENTFRLDYCLDQEKKYSFGPWNQVGLKELEIYGSHEMQALALSWNDGDDADAKNEPELLIGNINHPGSCRQQHWTAWEEFSSLGLTRSINFYKKNWNPKASSIRRNYFSWADCKLIRKNFKPSVRWSWEVASESQEVISYSYACIQDLEVIGLLCCPQKNISDLPTQRSNYCFLKKNCTYKTPKGRFNSHWTKPLPLDLIRDITLFRHETVKGKSIKKPSPKYFLKAIPLFS